MCFVRLFLHVFTSGVITEYAETFGCGRGLHGIDQSWLRLVPQSNVQGVNAQRSPPNEDAGFFVYFCAKDSGLRREKGRVKTVKQASA